MSTTMTPAAAGAAPPLPARSREDWRQQLGDVLGRDPAGLTDSARLADDLALDSLAMMTLVAWLDGNGVRVDAGLLQRVEDVLGLLARLPSGRQVSLAVRTPAGGDGPTLRATGATDLPVLPAPVSPLEPVLADHAFRLTLIRDDDIGFLYALAAHPQTGFRWRYRGAPPPPERFAAELWSQVLVQYVARRADTGEPAGLVVAYAPDLTGGHAFVGSVFRPEHTGAGLAAGATAMFVRYLFHTFPLRKLYLEVPGFNWPALRSGAGALFEVEGVLRDHDFYAGRYWDKYLCAIYPPARPAPGGPA
jgi:RimJ/RimL family protein N-acetyltransferase/aryl carrier-like protein